METYTLSEFRETPLAGSIGGSRSELVAKVSIALFENVENAAEVRKRLVAAALAEGEDGDKLREEMDYSFIEGNLIVSRAHLMAAVYTALQADEVGALKTKTLHSEILLGLNLTNNITDAIKRFGVSESTKRLIAVKVYFDAIDASAEHALKREQVIIDDLTEIVKGDHVSCDRLDGCNDADGNGVDWQRVKKVYKLNDVLVPKSANAKALYRSIIETSVAAKQALG